MKELGERLRRLRESVKLSQVKMAELLGVKQSSINRYEQGQSAPSLETLVRYADYFDVSLDYLLARTDNPQGKLYEYALCKRTFLLNRSFQIDQGRYGKASR